MTELEQKFLDALKTAQDGKQEEARKAFEEVIAADPKGDLADDALYNVGLLSFQQNKFDEAEKTFKQLIEEFPEATIAEFENSVEHGMTAAKAYLGLINCYLPMGREVEAWECLEKLEQFTDSYVTFADQRGVPFRKTYAMLGKELLDKFAAAKSELEMAE